MGVGVLELFWGIEGVGEDTLSRMSHTSRLSGDRHGVAISKLAVLNPRKRSPPILTGSGSGLIPYGLSNLCNWYEVIGFPCQLKSAHLVPSRRHKRSIIS